ncbi:MAG: DUF302 domain-containing protein [Pseudomonadota bacterium]
MKPMIRGASALLLSLSCLALAPQASAAQAAAPQPRVVAQHISPGSFSETLTALTTQLEADGWSQITSIDLGGRIAKKGVQIPAGLVVLELANCKNAIPILKSDETRYLSAMMPCRLSIYGLSDGRVVVAHLNTGLVGAMMDPMIGEVMASIDLHLDDSIQRALAKVHPKEQQAKGKVL